MVAKRFAIVSSALWALFHVQVALASDTDVLQRYEEMLNAQAALIDLLTDRVQRLEAMAVSAGNG